MVGPQVRDLVMPHPRRRSSRMASKRPALNLLSDSRFDHLSCCIVQQSAKWQSGSLVGGIGMEAASLLRRHGGAASRSTRGEPVWLVGVGPVGCAGAQLSGSNRSKGQQAVQRGTFRGGKSNGRFFFGSGLRDTFSFEVRGSAS